MNAPKSNIMSREYALIILDCDGTLVDSEPISNQVVAEMFSELGVPMTTERSIELFAGKKFAEIQEYLENAVEDIDVSDFEPRFRERSKLAFQDKLKPLPGVEKFIQKLQIPFCVASNGPRMKMQVTLEVSGLKKYFPDEIIFSAYDFNKWKPEPDLFLKCAEHFKVEPGEVLVIEDTVSGFDAARCAGMDCALFIKKESKPNFGDQAVYQFHHWDELCQTTKDPKPAETK